MRNSGSKCHGFRMIQLLFS
ncbi:MAG TPA: hypothetical protein DF409_08260 [Bacteroidales bacterium]|nr:hypothetical protein [Bacteroidales bacterium]